MKLELDMNEYLPLRDVVFKTLREAIIKGDLAPNERLMEIKLANMLGVSRTPVREAIRKLELEGLVIMNARRGAVVAPITKEDLIDVLDIRRAMERLGVELACQKITKEEIALLKKKNTEIEKAVEENDAQKIADFLAWCLQNSDTVIGILKAIGTAIATIFAVKVISNFANNNALRQYRLYDDESSKIGQIISYKFIKKLYKE